MSIISVHARHCSVAIIYGCLGFSIGCNPQSDAKNIRSKVKTAVNSRELSIAAASDLKFVLPVIIADFEAKHPDIRVQATFGSSGNFFAQLSNKAPFDLFLSADIAYPHQLVEMGLADADTLFTYATGQIVVWVPKDSPLDVESLGVHVFRETSIKKIAIANPKHAPYGRAAEAAMKSLGIYEQAVDRLIFGENVAQTAQFVETGGADFGIIALSLALSPALREKGRYWLIPETAYPRLVQGGVIVSWAKEKSAAEQFRNFLMSDQSRSFLHDRGFKNEPTIEPVQ